MAEFVLELVIEILIALAPDRRENHVWYVAVCILILLSCSACMFMIEITMQAKH